MLLVAACHTDFKGNQEKWLEDGRWYKLNLFGYEGVAETVTSKLLQKINIEELGFSYVAYRMERMEVHCRVRNGCSSPNFLMPGEAILTLADLLRKGVSSQAKYRSLSAQLCCQSTLDRRAKIALYRITKFGKLPAASRRG